MILENRLIKYLLYITLGVSLLTALSVNYRRVIFEAQNHQVETVMSYRNVQRLAVLSGVGVDDVLEDLKNKGQITTISVEEEQVRDLADNAKITILKGSEIENLNRVGYVSPGILKHLYRQVSIDPNKFYLVIDEIHTYERVRDFLTAAYTKKNVKRVGRRNILEVMDEEELLLNTGIGFDAEIIEKLDEMGFGIIPRLRNSHRLTDQVIKQKFQNLEQFDSVKTILFAEKQVLGYPGYLKLTQRKIKEAGYQVGFIEFANQAGDKELFETLPNSIIRVHGIPDKEMEILTVDKAVRRYLRAVKERSVNILMVSPFLDIIQHDDNLMDVNRGYVDQVHKGVEAFGYTVMPNVEIDSHSYKSARVWEIFLMSMGVLSVFLLLMRQYIPLTFLRMLMVVSLFGVLFYCAILFKAMAAWVAGIGAFTAILFPTYAIVSRFPNEDSPELQQNRSSAAILYVLRLFFISLLGGLFIVGFLSDIRYLMGIERFFGVKISFIVPLILIGMFFFLRPHRIPSMVYVFKRLFFAPIRTSSLIAVMFCVVFVVIYILRSGNYLSFQVPYIEENMRAILEDVLFVRPRTKEFLIGYPFLIAAFLYVDRYISRQWLWYYNTIGSVALISVINSFCHLHTPVLVSAYRGFLGLGVGILVAVIYWASIQLFRMVIRKLS